MSFANFLEEKVATKAVESEEVELTEAEKKAKKSYTIKFEVTGAAFEDDFDGEVDTVVKQAIKIIQRGTLDKPLRDSNGNTVGSVK